MKKFLLAAALLSAVMITSGCFDIFDYVPENAPENNGGGISDTVRELIEAGDLDGAEEKLIESCEKDKSGYAHSSYLSFLAEQGRLDALSDNFPADENVIFFGKALSEYSDEELLKMAGDDRRIGYHTEEPLTDYVWKWYTDGECPVLPYGVEKTMSRAEMFEAVGFTSELSELFSDMYHVRIDLSGDKPVFSVKRTDYAPFSQHPPEEWELTIRRGKTELSFTNTGESLSGYSVTVYV